MIEEVKEVIHQLLHHLPDNDAHDGPAGCTWYWCWKELSDTAQAEVKAVRKSANDLLTKLYATEEETLYIVGSKDGYFVRFENDTPLMITDPICATRMKAGRAVKVSKRLGELGFVGNLTELRFGRMK